MTFELIPWLWLPTTTGDSLWEGGGRVENMGGGGNFVFGACCGRKLNLSRMRQCDLHTSRKTTPFYGVCNLKKKHG